MKFKYGLTIIATLLLVTTTTAQEKPDYNKLLADILPGIGHDDIEKRRESQQKWQALCLEAGAPMHEADRKVICLAMVDALAKEPNVPAQVFLLRQLERIGKAESIATLATSIQSENGKVHDAARRALINIPDKSAGDALRTALTELKDIKRAIAIINGLGYRGEPESIKDLTPLSSALDPNILKASVGALAKIDDPKAESAIRKLFEAGLRPSDLTAYANAYMTVADRMIGRGETKAAAEMYRKLAKEKFKTTLRLAVAEGRLKTCTALDESPGELVETYLTGDDEQVRTVAGGFIRHLSDASIEKLANRCNRFSKSAQLAFLRGVGPTRKWVALPGVVGLLETEDDDVRIAAIGALAGLANEKTVPVLVKLMLEGGPDGDAAARSLEKVHADGIDDRLVELMKTSKDVERRKRFMQVLDRRRSTSAVPAILEEAAHHDRSVRDMAIRYLQRLASEKNIPAMIKTCIKTDDRGERDVMEKAIVAVCRRILDPAKQDDAVIKVYIESSPSVKNEMLPLLGRIGSDEVLVLVRAAVSNPKNEDYYQAGVNALSNWPDAKVTEDLMRVSTHENQSIRIRSVRALARVVVLRDERSDQERLKLLQQTMDKAERNQERDLILDRARSIRLIETLRFVVPYLDKEDLRERACQTIVDLAHQRGLRQPNQAEFDKVLAKVMETTKDKKLAERAKGYMTKK